MILPLAVSDAVVTGGAAIVGALVALGHAGLGPKRIAARLARPEWGGLKVSPNGVWKLLRRHGLSTRRARLALLAGYRAPYEPPREPQPEPHLESRRPGELVGFDCFFVGRLLSGGFLGRL